MHGAAFAALASIGIGYPLEEPRNLFTGLKAMYRPVSPHGDRGDAVKRSDLITIEGGKGFVVLVEEGGNLDFKRFRHRFPPRVVPFHIIVVHNDGQRCHCGSTCGTSAHVEGFGCRPIAAMRLAPWPASESLQ